MCFGFSQEKMIKASIEIPESAMSTALCFNILVMLILMAYSVRIKFAVCIVLLVVSYGITSVRANILPAVAPEFLTKDSYTLSSVPICAGWNNLFIYDTNKTISFLGKACNANKGPKCPTNVPTNIRNLMFDGLTCKGPSNCEPGFIENKDVIVTKHGYLDSFNLDTKDNHWFVCDADPEISMALNFRCDNCGGGDYTRACAMSRSMKDEDSHSRLISLSTHGYLTLAQVEYCQSKKETPTKINITFLEKATFKVTPSTAIIRVCKTRCLTLANERGGIYDLSEHFNYGDSVLISAIDEGSSVRKTFTIPFKSCFDITCFFCFDNFINGCYDSAWATMLNWAMVVGVVILAWIKGCFGMIMKIMFRGSRINRRIKKDDNNNVTSLEDDNEENELIEKSLGSSTARTSSYVSSSGIKFVKPSTVMLIAMALLIPANVESCHQTLAITSVCIRDHCNSVTDFAAIQGFEYCFDGDEKIKEHFTIKVVDSYYYANTLFMYTTNYGAFKQSISKICTPTCTSSDCNNRETLSFDYVKNIKVTSVPIKSGCHNWETPMFQPCVFGSGCYWWSSKFEEEGSLQVFKVQSWNPAVQIEVFNDTHRELIEVKAGETKKVDDTEIFVFHSVMPEREQLYWLKDLKTEKSFFSFSASEVSKPQKNKVGWLQRDSKGTLSWDVDSISCKYDEGIDCKSFTVGLEDMKSPPIETSVGHIMVQQGLPIFHEERNSEVHLRISTSFGISIKASEEPCSILSSRFEGSFSLNGAAHLIIQTATDNCYLESESNGRTVYDYVRTNKTVVQKWTLQDEQPLHINGELMQPEFHLVRPLLLFANETLTTQETSLLRKTGFNFKFYQFCANGFTMLSQSLSFFKTWIFIALTIICLLMVGYLMPLLRWVLLIPLWVKLIKIARPINQSSPI